MKLSSLNSRRAAIVAALPLAFLALAQACSKKAKHGQEIGPDQVVDMADQASEGADSTHAPEGNKKPDEEVPIEQTIQASMKVSLEKCKTGTPPSMESLVENWNRVPARDLAMYVACRNGVREAGGPSACGIIPDGLGPEWRQLCSTATRLTTDLVLPAVLEGTCKADTFCTDDSCKQVLTGLCAAIKANNSQYCTSLSSKGVDAKGMQKCSAVVAGNPGACPAGDPFFLGVGMDDEFLHCDDFALAVQAARHGKVSSLPEDKNKMMIARLALASSRSEVCDGMVQDSLQPALCTSLYGFAGMPKRN